MRTSKPFSAALALALILGLEGQPFAADAEVPVRAGPAHWQQPVKSVRALRDEGVVKQAYDYSCGSAALATLLTFGAGDAVDEAWVLATVFASASPEQRQLLTEKGLSLLDLQRVAALRGHQSQGFRLGADQLTRLSRPVIVYVRPQGYPHFAVLKGVRGDRAYLADPSLGNVRLPLYRFLDMWADEGGRGVVFVLEPPGGRWPDVQALAAPSESGPPLEALTAHQLLEVGKTYPLTLPRPLLR